jgi:hypothetical protein
MTKVFLTAASAEKIRVTDPTILSDILVHSVIPTKRHAQTLKMKPLREETINCHCLSIKHTMRTILCFRHTPLSMKLLSKSVLLQALRQKTRSEVADIRMQPTSENYMIKKTTPIIHQEQNEDRKANRYPNTPYLGSLICLFL